MIVIDSVTKRYGRGPRGGVAALDGVSIGIPRGGVHAVVGPNGAGKSTLFALLLGFVHPTAGEITVDGEDPRDYVRRNGAGYLPERFALPAEWRVRDALLAFAERERLGAGRQGGRSMGAAAADAAIDRFGLSARADAKVGALSRGMLQRLGLAQALLAGRALIVLDEPTEGLDPGWRLRLRSEIARLREEGHTVLLASHDLAEVEQLADRVIVLERGRVREVLEARPATPGQAYRLVLAGGAAEVEALFPGAESLAGSMAAGGDEPRPGPANAGTGSPDAARDGVAYRVRVADVHELNARLAALLATGALVAAVLPDSEPLEARVRRALGERD